MDPEILNSLRESLNGSTKITDRIDPQKINEEQKKKIKKVDNKKKKICLKKCKKKV